MPHLALVVDPDPDRRAAFRDRVRHRFGSEPDLEVSESTTPGAWVGWAAAPHVPVSLAVGGTGAARGGAAAAPTSARDGLAGLLGTARDPGSGAPLAAEELAERLGSPVGAETAADGFFLAFSIRRDRVAVLADPLGLFPVYHASRGPVIVVSTSPHLLACHPLFPIEVDARGLVGILLTQDPVGDRTVVAAARRLGAGDVLVWTPARGPRAHPGYRFPRVRDPGRPAADDVARVSEALGEAVHREVVGRSALAHLLSGGRDSRVLAGLASLTRRGGLALVMGREGDHELETARRVAERLGLDIVSHDPRPEGYLEAARRAARWEPLTGGVSNVHVWDLVSPLRSVPPACVNGYVLDSLVGGRWFYSAGHPTRSAPFPAVLGWVNRWGIARERLERLLRPELAGLVAEVVGDLERAYDEGSNDPAERPWRFIMAHANRYRIGGNAWRISFGSWPVMPALHTSLLDAVATVDQAAIAQNRAQDEILRRRLPALARIPLVENNADPGLPPRSSRWERMAFRVRRRFGPSPDVRARRRERRVNWRAYDFNHPGWCAIRRSAESDRDALAEFFRMDEVARYLPGPEETPVSGTFFDLMGPQVLVGLILWARENL